MASTLVSTMATKDAVMLTRWLATPMEAAISRPASSLSPCQRLTAPHVMILLCRRSVRDLSARYDVAVTHAEEAAEYLNEASRQADAAAGIADELDLATSAAVTAQTAISNAIAALAEAVLHLADQVAKRKE
jgi:hypothetical protein